MIKNIYDVALKLITPSEQGGRLDFTAKQDEILEAACFFNEKFRTWSKRIIVYMISRKSIHLLLLMESEKQEHVTAREIRFFTAYLNNQKGWHEYSRNSSKLFEGVNFASCSLEAAQRQTAGIEKDSELGRMQAEDIEFLANESLRSASQPALYTGQDEHGMSDEDALAIVSYLVQTRNKGERSAQKAETLSRLKEILKEWL